VSTFALQKHSMSQEKLTPLEELGEFGLIEKINQLFPIKNDKIVLGIGDDSAAFQSNEELTLTSTDMYVEGVHFDLVYTPLQHLGYKVVAATVSDIYAMNGTPQYLTLGIAMSSKFTVEAIDALLTGMRAACTYYNVELIGGDTTTSRMGLCLSLTAIGKVAKDKMVTRAGAKNGDVLVVTGDLGGAYMGLQILEREKRVYLETPDMQPELQGHEYILKRQLRPEARKDVIDQLAELNIVPNAMIDVSDGLGSEAMHIAKASGLGCKLFEDKFPIDEATSELALSFRMDPSICVLSGGEDYELLMAVSIDDYEKLKNLPDFTAVGHTTGALDTFTYITHGGNEIKLDEVSGFKHF